MCIRDRISCYSASAGGQQDSGAPEHEEGQGKDGEQFRPCAQKQDGCGCPGRAEEKRHEQMDEDCRCCASAEKNGADFDESPGCRVNHPVHGEEKRVEGMGTVSYTHLRGNPQAFFRCGKDGGDDT